MHGTHLTVDMSGCAPEHPWMHKIEALREGCIAAVRSAGLHMVGECFHAFSPLTSQFPGGITGVVLLAESHLAVHTWPEHGRATLDVFVCNLTEDNTHRAQQLLATMLEGFGAANSQVQRLDRPMPSA